MSTSADPFEPPDAAKPLLSCICASTVDDEVIVALHGEIDMASAPLLRDLLEAAQGLERPVLVDLSDVGFMDSSGVHELLLAHARGPVRILDPSPLARRTLELTGLTFLLADGAGASAPP